jgi:PD-(D/E)XK endonuclease
MGELAELAFMYKASSLGFGVARPYGDSHPYDVLLQYGRRLLRIQVKSVFSTYRSGNHLGYPVGVSRHQGRGRSGYSEDDIDFIAAFVAPHEAWYVIPVESLLTRKFIRLYPGGRKRKNSGLFEQYHEAWHLLKDKVEEDGDGLGPRARELSS